jgi:hypothetical protein
LPNHYLHVKKQFPAAVGNEDYTISGVYFRQQNNITNVCAHASATMMLNNASLPLGIITAEDINKLLGFDHKKKKFKISEGCVSKKENLPAGLGMPQLSAVFRHYGYEPFLLEFDDENKQRKFRSFIYGFIESQYPALLTFGSHEGSSAAVIERRHHRRREIAFAEKPVCIKIFCDARRRRTNRQERAETSHDDH